MALTPEDVRALQAPFAFNEHEFLEKSKNGKVTAELAYITEEAVTARLDAVDPSWSFAIVRIERSAKQVVVDAVLTVKGVSREGIGMQKIDDEFGEAEKGAATDALKRCARLFSISRYLLDGPKWKKEFIPWLAQIQKAYAASGTFPEPQQQPEQQQSSGSQPFFAMGDVHKGISDLYPTDNHRAAVVEKGQREGWLTKAMSTDEWVKAIYARHDAKAAHWTADKVQAADFLEWAKAYYDTTKAIGAALQAAVQYPVAKLADWKGTVAEAQAAVLAAHCEYDRARIDAVTNAMHDLAESERAELALLARQVVERAKFNGVQPEKVVAR